MRGIRLLVNLIGYGSFFGLVSGAVLGILYYLIVFQFSVSVFIVYAIILGAAVGVFLGGINGIGFFVVTASLYHLLNLGSYKALMLFTALIITALAGFLVFTALFSVYAANRTTGYETFPLALAMVFAVIPAGLLSQSAVQWFTKTRDPENA